MSNLTAGGSVPDPITVTTETTISSTDASSGSRSRPNHITRVKAHLQNGTKDATCTLEDQKCDSEHVFNPATCSCVLKTSALGKLILKFNSRKNEVPTKKGLPAFADERIVNQLKTVGETLEAQKGQANTMNMEIEKVKTLMEKKEEELRNLSDKLQNHEIAIEQGKEDSKREALNLFENHKTLFDEKLSNLVEKIEGHQSVSEELKNAHLVQKALQEQHANLVDQHRIQLEQQEARISSLGDLKEEEKYKRDQALEEMRIIGDSVNSQSLRVEQMHAQLQTMLEQSERFAKLCEEASIIVREESSRSKKEIEKDFILMREEVEKRALKIDADFEARIANFVTEVTDTVKAQLMEMVENSSNEVKLMSSQAIKEVQKVTEEELKRVSVASENSNIIVSEAEKTGQEALHAATQALEASKTATEQSSKQIETVKRELNNAIEAIQLEVGEKVKSFEATVSSLSSTAQAAVSNVQEELSGVQSALAQEESAIRKMNNDTITAMSQEVIRQKTVEGALNAEERSIRHIGGSASSELDAVAEAELTSEAVINEKRAEIEDLVHSGASNIEQELIARDEVSERFPVPDSVGGEPSMEMEALAEQAKLEFMRKEAETMAEEHEIEEQKKALAAQHQRTTIDYQEAQRMSNEAKRHGAEADHALAVAASAVNELKKTELNAVKHPDNASILSQLQAAQENVARAEQAAQIAEGEAMEAQQNYEERAKIVQQEEAELEENTKLLHSNQAHARALEHELDEAAAALRAAEASKAQTSYLNNIPDPFLHQGHHNLNLGPKLTIDQVVREAQQIYPGRYGQGFDHTQDYGSSRLLNSGHPAVKGLTEVEKYLGYKLPETTRRPSLYPSSYQSHLRGGAEKHIFSQAQQAHITEAAMKALLQNGISPKTHRDKYTKIMHMVRSAASEGKEIVINPMDE